MATSCPLTTGFDYECDSSTGGIKPGSLLITQWENITATTVVAGELTAITQASATAFYRYKIKKEIVSFDGNETHDPLIGSNFYEDTITAMLFNMSKEKNVEFKLLSGKPLFIILQDLNDVYHAFGVQSGAEKIGSTRSSGKEYGTMNGYTMVFSSKDTNLYTVDSTVVAGLVVDGEST
jgi:hypothetical protein